MADEEIEAPLPRGGYAIDWDNVDLNALDPFATKSKVSTNFGTSAPAPIVNDNPAETKDTKNIVKSPGSTSPDENKKPESFENNNNSQATDQSENKSVKKPAAKKKTTESFETLE